jgi:hypothetical protein
MMNQSNIIYVLAHYVSTKIVSMLLFGYVLMCVHFYVFLYTGDKIHEISITS